MRIQSLESVNNIQISTDSPTERGCSLRSCVELDILLCPSLFLPVIVGGTPNEVHKTKGIVKVNCLSFPWLLYNFASSFNYSTNIWAMHDNDRPSDSIPYWSSVNSPHKGQWRGALMFSLICVLINVWVSSRGAGDLRRYRAHYDVTVWGFNQWPSNPGSLYTTWVSSWIVKEWTDVL